MKKTLSYLIIFVLLSTIAFASGVSVSTNAFFTVDPLLMQQNIYQKFYVDIYLTRGLGFKYSGYTDSGNLSTQEFYFFLNNLLGLSLKAGVFKDYTSLTRKLHYIQVGGIPYSIYGKRNDLLNIKDYFAVKADYKLGFADLGGIYVKNDGYGSKNLKYFYLQTDLGLLKAGAYYSSKEHINGSDYFDMLSADFNANLGPLSLWGGVDGVTNTFDTSSLTYLVGGSFSIGNFGPVNNLKFAAQFEKGPLVQLILPDFKKFNTLRIDTNLSFALGGLKTNLWYNITDLSDSDNGMELGASLNYGDLTLTYTNYDQLNDYYMNGVTGTNRLTIEYAFRSKFDLTRRPLMDISFTNNKPKKHIAKGPREDGSYPIAYALEKLMGKDDVILEGVVTVAPGTFSRGQYTYIQDDTGAILIYGRGKKLKVGDKVMFVGRLVDYHGTPELKISGADSEQIVGKGKAIVHNIKASNVENYLNDLVKISGVIVREGRNVFIKDESGRVKIYIKKPTGISWDIFKGGEKGFIIGVVSQYKGEYEILPRSNKDINIK